jgi:hypothetical protein
MNATVLRHRPESTSERLGWLTAGFIFGALAVLVFHQGAWALLHAIGFTDRAAFPMQPTEPFALPQVWSATLWGGLWGVLLAAAVHQLEGARLLLAATLFGLVLPTLAAWFIVAAIKGQPLAAGLDPKAMMLGPIVNGAWGLGTGLGLVALARWERRRDEHQRAA